MKLSIRRFSVFACCLTAVCLLTLGQSRLGAADSQASLSNNPRDLIAVLKSDAPPQNKAMACKKLAIYGNQDAIPALAPLLLDEQLASWARIALEAIPGPAADQALREALSKTQGRLLVGVINSIGFRRDTQATGKLMELLKASSADVASAAAVSLGKIGGDDAANGLSKLLGEAPVSVRSAIAEGCIGCAELFLANGNNAAATRLYDMVRQSQSPKQRILEATRGAILARKSAGIPLLMEQLRSADKAAYSMGLRTARELPGREVTEVLAAELDRTPSDRQASLLLALADRRDEAVLPKVIEMAGKGSEAMRIVAVSVLDQLGDPTSMPVLLEAATHSNTTLAQSAKAAVARLESKKVDADILSRLSQSQGKMRLVLIELVGQRRIEAALPIMMRYVEDSDPETRRAALDTVGAIGSEKQVADVVRMLPKASASQDRANMEKTLMTLCGRWGISCASSLLPLAQNSDRAMRRIALRALASVGGPEALSTITKAVKDPDEATQDEAVGLLATWPGNWPEDVAVAEPLLALAKSGTKTLHQVQGVRGYLQFLQENKNLKDQEKLTQFKELLPFIKRPDEKRLAIATANVLPPAGALAILTDFAADSAVSEEACMAIVNLATSKKLKDVPKEQGIQALQKVLNTSQNDGTKKKADTALKSLQ